MQIGDLSLLTVDPTTIFTGQEGHDSGDVHGETTSVQRRDAGQRLLNLLRVEVLASWNVVLRNIGEHVRLDTTRCNRVDSDAQRSEVCSTKVSIDVKVMEMGSQAGLSLILPAESCLANASMVALLPG